MYQSHHWQEQIKIETITSLKNMHTIWLAKHDKSVLIIFSDLAVTFMLSIRQLLTCAFQFLVGKIPQKERWYQSACIIWCGNTDSCILSYHGSIRTDSIVMIEITYEPSSYYIFDRSYNNFKMLYKIHQIETYFVVRAKKNLGYKSIQWKRRLPKNVLSDASVLLTGFYPKQYYPEPLRLVKYWDEEQEREFIFITNAMHISALQVAELYKNRWQVELFFKWLKQHLKIKRFWGTTENAVRIQIYAAICAYCLVAIIQHDMQLDRSTYEVLQILSISLTDKTYLRDLFNKTKFQNDKELFGPNGPSLFNF